MIKLTKKPATLADDLLHGAEAFAEFVFGKADKPTLRKVYYLLSKGELPATKVGNLYIGRKSLVTARLSQIDAG